MSMDSGDLSNARVLVPDSGRVLEGIWAASDALYIVARNGVQFELLRLGYAPAAALEKIQLPYVGSIAAVDANVLLPGALFGMQSWVQTPSALYYDPKTRRVSDTKIVPPDPADFSHVQAREVEAKSADGTMVPLSIVCQKDIKLDGSHPALYEGYGSYGISIDPSFHANVLAWVERGGVWAIVHARGGGEYGERWHNAGRKSTKQHTIDDMIAAAHYLIDNGYSSPEHLAVRGTSAGGISVGGAITQHPELFAVGIDNVGATNMLRFQTTQGGAANVPEFGDVNDAEGFRNLYQMSAFHHVQDGTKYPAIMGMTGVNDPRVPSWIIAEMIARLQAASSSGKPVLLRVDFDAGHGLGSSRIQREQQTADEWTFILWQTGDPEFNSATLAAR
jgi:prolyl oligopeptidase